MRAPLPLALLLAACSGGDAAPAASAREPTRAAAAVDPAQGEAAELGRELFGIMDRVLAYRSDHFDRLPRDLPTVGIDSLTRTTVRRLSVSGAVPRLVVAYRHAEGHAVAQCSGTDEVIEDSMLNSGAFTVSCTLVSGETRDFTVGG